MDFELLPLEQADIVTFKHDIQEAFQKGYEDVFGKPDAVSLICKEKNRERSIYSVDKVF